MLPLRCAVAEHASTAMPQRDIQGWNQQGILVYTLSCTADDRKHNGTGSIRMQLC
jgi:hypothetical protein